jgi:hypothetical protein
MALALLVVVLGFWLPAPLYSLIKSAALVLSPAPVVQP